MYNAVGLCAFELYDQLDYDTWYQTQLLKELTVSDPRLVSLYMCYPLPYYYVSLTRYKIVRHRVVWLLGQWVTVKMSSSLRPSLYSVVVPILAQTEDMAVRDLYFFPFCDMRSTHKGMTN